MPQRCVVQYGDGSCALYLGQPQRILFSILMTMMFLLLRESVSFFSFVVLEYCLSWYIPIFSSLLLLSLSFRLLHPNETGGV